MENGVFNPADLVWLCCGLTRFHSGKAAGEGDAGEEKEQRAHCRGWDSYNEGERAIDFHLANEANLPY